MLSLIAAPYHDGTRLYEAALVVRQASGANGTSSTRCSFTAERASKEPGADERMIADFASKVKKAADAFERHWPMSGRAESSWLAAGDVVQKCRVRSCEREGRERTREGSSIVGSFSRESNEFFYYKPVHSTRMESDNEFPDARLAESERDNQATCATTWSLPCHPEYRI